MDGTQLDRTQLDGTQATALVRENVMPRKQVVIICDADRMPAQKTERVVKTRGGWLPRWLRFLGF
jgi:hypothetical protein